MSGRSIGELGETVSRLTRSIEEASRAKGVKGPTINDEVASDLEIDPQVAQELTEATRELEVLVQGPRPSLGLMGLMTHDASSLGVLVAFDIPSLVPLGGSITFGELSKKSGLDEDRLTRIVRYTMLNFVFREEPVGHVCHTALSAHLAQAPNFCDFLRTIAAVFGPANSCLPIALKNFPQTQSMTQAAHNIARGTRQTFYEWLDARPHLRDNFDVGMEGISRGGQRLQDTDLRAYPWHALPPNARVVDMGGSGGHLARDLAESFPSFSFVVQDLPQVIEVALEQNKASPITNVTYEAHNFFNAQPRVGADVYFMRHVFHNHPDKECIDILQALLPGLKPQARVLVSEYIVPPAEEAGRGLGTKAMRQMDLMTMALFNAKERTKAEYSALFQQASPALTLESTYQVPDDLRSCIFEAIYRG
ncbi:S-adenosyl-L-methionine-dependent methyltransferase [Thozetella sp. PMI_491]|nr:S-adenosyl-L-methionine-dependent methyltransferase [Thozetella sp. PMI_491]